MHPVFGILLLLGGVAAFVLILYGGMSWLEHREARRERALERARSIEDYQDHATVEDLERTRRRINEALDRQAVEIEAHQQNQGDEQS